MNASPLRSDGLLRLLCATANPGKVAELAELLAPVAELLTRPDGIGDIDEVADTLEGNARIKAGVVAESPLNRERVAAIADDTGLEVDALGGAPGVRSARYSPEGGDAANRARLLAELAALGDGVSRRARFRTVIAVVWPDGVRAPLVVEGVCLGRIAESERGRGGFGYDSLFIPDAGPADGPADGAMTFAEMSFADKQAISHRSRAIAALIAALADQHSD